jgi:RNA polymerase sigma-70 factor (ECF subfamily)
VDAALRAGSAPLTENRVRLDFLESRKWGQTRLSGKRHKIDLIGKSSLTLLLRLSVPARTLADASSDSTGDEALMLAYAAGEAGAFDALYARHKGGVYRYLIRHCGNAGTADEMFQDVWMNLIRARASYAPSARFTTWLYRIAHNRLVDHWRESGRVELVGADPDDDDDPVAALPAATAEEPDARVAAREQGARLAEALRRLPPAQRDAFLLHQEGGLALAAIAELTGVGIETVKSRIRYALARLRTDLQDLR